MAGHMRFFVGDSDLRFLGLAAALAARHHMIRKGGRVPTEGFPRSDREAFTLLNEGLDLGASIPLDDVPEIWISVEGERVPILRLLDVARPQRDQHEGEDDDTAGEEWRGAE